MQALTTLQAMLFKMFTPKTGTIRNNGFKIRRNEPCPCGSGAKYKKCCLPVAGR